MRLERRPEDQAHEQPETSIRIKTIGINRYFNGLLRGEAIAIHGAFVDRDSLDDAWGVCGRKTITPCDISFPQALIGHMYDRGECAFRWGEIQIPIPFNSSWLYSTKVYLTRHSTKWWPETVLGTLGHLEKVPEQFRHAANLSSTDLRYNPLRSVVEKHLKFDCNDTYFEVQRSLGMDIGRLLDVT